MAFPEARRPAARSTANTGRRKRKLRFIIVAEA